MTAYRFVTLTCDECGEIYDDGESRKETQARRSAKRDGWARDERGDTCPSHNGYTRSSGLGWWLKDEVQP